MALTLQQSTRSAAVNDDVKIAYTTAGNASSERAILLIHGYPQTMYSMRHVQKLLADQQYFVVTADYRGAGGSSITSGGYDKVSMAEDLHQLMHQVLGRAKYIVLGHDIGSMVATALAFAHRESVQALIMMECPQPGTSQYHHFVTDRDITMELTFHFFFHNSKDLPELLTHGKEDAYLQHFYDRLAFNPYFLTAEDRRIYVDSFARAGRMKAGFEVYRAFRKDDDDIKRFLQKDGKLTCPVLATGGSHSLFSSYIKGMADELASNVSFAEVEDASHWVPEENADGLVREMLHFFSTFAA